MNNKPWLAAILNLVLPGLGYIYAGKRMLFGSAVLLYYLAIYYTAFFLPSTTVDEPLTTIEKLTALMFLLLSIAFSYDAYRDVVENKKQES